MRESLVKCDGSDVSLIKKAYSTKRLAIGESVKLVELLIAGSSGMYQIDMRNMSGIEFRNQPNITDSNKLYAKGSNVSNDIGLLWSGVIDRRTGQCRLAVTAIINGEITKVSRAKLNYMLLKDGA